MRTKHKHTKHKHSKRDKDVGSEDEKESKSERRERRKARRQERRARDEERRERRRKKHGKRKDRDETSSSGSASAGEAAKEKEAPARVPLDRGAPDDNEPGAEVVVAGPAPPPQADTKGSGQATEPEGRSRRTLGALTPAEFAKQQSQTRREFDPHTGRTRLVKGSGEIVEEIVSREEQLRRRHTASTWIPPTQYTGKQQFPSQHPWFGFK